MNEDYDIEQSLTALSSEQRKDLLNELISEIQKNKNDIKGCHFILQQWGLLTVPKESKMTKVRALEIVLDLAEQNIVDDPDMEEDSQEQEKACEMVAEMLGQMKKKKEK